MSHPPNLSTTIPRACLQQFSPHSRSCLAVKKQLQGQVKGEKSPQFENIDQASEPESNTAVKLEISDQNLKQPLNGLMDKVQSIQEQMGSISGVREILRKKELNKNARNEKHCNRN